MLVDALDSAGDLTAAAVLDRYEEELASIVIDVGHEKVATATGLEPAQVEAIGEGSSADLELTDVAAVLSLVDDYPAADQLLAETRDHLLLEMSSAMLTVDRIARGLDGELDPKEIQAKIEGRYPMTLSEYAWIHHYIATHS